MAGYQYLKGNPRPHRFIVKRKGHRTLTKAFVIKDDGERWAREQERSIDLTGIPIGIDKLADTPVEAIVDRYLNEITPTKTNESETYTLERFKVFAKGKSLASFAREDAYAYRAKRLRDTWRGPQGNWKTAKPIKASTVKREMVVLHHVFETAREQWGYDNLTNPFAGKVNRIKGSKRQRSRRLEEGELERLIEACKKCLGLNRTYIPLAIYLTVETGMRLDEIFNLTWEDLDVVNRRIEIRKSKTDHVSEYDGRTIVMSVRAMLHASRLPHQLKAIHGEFSVQPSDAVFPMTKDAFEQAFDDVLTRAKITADKRGERLQFRDLRREANSRFDQMLTVAECELMLGHKGNGTNAIYRTAALKLIQDKLDEYHLGKTLAQVEAEREPLTFEGQLVWVTNSPEGRVISFPAIDASNEIKTKRKANAAE
ncbi:tyrosine-type recombinase/integrase [Bradyrhizobium sp. UFLA03-84]|uniref:tyrosine-type recombinase/integrase n=1 Tax=Bradyrhizobium sp. UFLA03-84 TaxID=418599 RepID=UPI001177B085|nr:tyrosine-type recombinase/integrase [Bradyrhizobium sp. UFLA03-84]